MPCQRLTIRMIPKKIHYVWVGTQPKSELVLHCLDSWKRYLPDYEIREWGNRDFGQIRNTYADEAFRHRKWAFVSDYIRLHALYHEGGVYLDADVEIVANLDPFLVHDFFTGYENYKGVYAPVTAVMGAIKGNGIIGDLLAYYATARFAASAGPDLLPNTATIAAYFERRFALHRPYAPGAVYRLNPTAVIYPSTHFCTPEPGFESYAVHHFSGSWVETFARRNKLTFFHRLIVARFRRRVSRPDSELPLAPGEKLLFAFNRNGRIVWALLYRRAGHAELPVGQGD